MRKSPRLAKIAKGILYVFAGLAVVFVFSMMNAPRAAAVSGDNWTVDSLPDWENGTWDNSLVTMWKPADNNGLRIYAENAAGWWGFDDGAGNATDNTDNGLHGQLVGNAAYTTGKFGSAMTFDGAGDYVNVGDNSEFYFGAGSFTAMGWVKSTTSHYGTFFGKGQTSSLGWRLIVRAEGYTWLALRFDTGAINVQGGGNIFDGNWHHVVGVVNKENNTASIYIDGTGLIDTDISVHASGSVNSTTSFWIGTNEGETEPFNGQIDEVRVFNRALSENEMRQHFEQGRIIDNIDTGKWVSTWWDVGETTTVLSLDATASIVAGENVDAVVSVNDAAAWDGTEENAAVPLNNGTNNYGINTSGRYVAVTFTLNTDNSNHTPFVDNFNVNTGTPLVAEITIENISVDNILLDRDVDNPDVGVDTITSAKIQVNVEFSNYVFADNVHFSIFDKNSELVDNAVATENTELGDNSQQFGLVFTADNWSFLDDNLGAFDVAVRVFDNGSVDNGGSATSLFTVDDLFSSRSVENRAGHEIRIYGTASRVSGAALTTLDNVAIVDNAMGASLAGITGNDWENIYSPTETGSFYMVLGAENLDGSTENDNVLYEYPNMLELLSVSVDNSLIDRDTDYSGSGADLNTVITVQARDNDNDQVYALLSIRDVLDVAVLTDENISASESWVDNVTVNFTYTYTATDNTLTDDNLGAWDVNAVLSDNYNASVDNNWVGDGVQLFTVDDLVSTVEFDEASPYYGWDLTVSGTISRVSGGTASADNAWLIDENHGTVVLGAGNAWSTTYLLDDVVPSENVDATLRALDAPLDGENATSYLVNSDLKYQIEVRWENDYAVVGSPDDGLTIADRNWTVKFNWDGGMQENTLATNPENIIVVSEGNTPNVAALNDNDNYWRRRIPSTGGGTLTFVLPKRSDADSAVVYQYTMTITDYTGTFDTPDGWVSLRKYIDNNFVKVNDDWWDATNHSYAYLVLHDWYEVYLFNESGSQRHLGHIQAEADTTLDAFTVGALDFGENKVFKYEILTFEATRGAETGYVTLKFADAHDNTDNIVWRVYTSDNDLRYTAEFAYPSDLEATWINSDNDNSYWLSVEVSHREFGSFTEWFAVGSIIVAWENDVVPGSAAGIGDILGAAVPLAGLAGLFIVGVIAMSFGAKHASTAMLGISITAMFLKFLSWKANANLMPLTTEAIILLLVISIAWKAGEKI